MKKTAIIALLILAIAASLLAGTLASYTITIDDLATGSVTGKEFIFTKDGSDTFASGVKIAPTETVIWEFAVRNYNGVLITETDLYYRLTFNVTNLTGKTAIEPLIVSVKDEQGNTLKSITGTGVIHIYDAFMLSPSGQRAAYTVEIYWPSNIDIDINYAGNAYGTAINVSATASQLPFDQQGDISDPDISDPDISEPDDNDPEIVMGDGAITFKTSEYWTEGQYWDSSVGALVGGTDKYRFDIVITNTSETETIYGWQLGFILEDTITSYWNYRLQSYNALTNEYVIQNPQYFNIEIAPGQSVEMGGIAVGRGQGVLSSVTVNGLGAEVEYQYGVIVLD